MERRQLRSNSHFDGLFADLDPSNEEIAGWNECLELLLRDPERGMKITYSGYAGNHRAIEFGRFVVVYQFSARELRPKDIQLLPRTL